MRGQTRAGALTLDVGYLGLPPLRVVANPLGADPDLGFLGLPFAPAMAAAAPPVVVTRRPILFQISL